MLLLACMMEVGAQSVWQLSLSELCKTYFSLVTHPTSQLNQCPDTHDLVEICSIAGMLLGFLTDDRSYVHCPALDQAQVLSCGPCTSRQPENQADTPGDGLLPPLSGHGLVVAHQCLDHPDAPITIAYRHRFLSCSIRRPRQCQPCARTASNKH